ncbi:Serpentine Receptor, class E (Epsilon) [Caenorhabditis elegans]|uniref:Serpentine Receptor, class E (Epsilon) n=1 Tax=Caenorhabditis elegans TaxID=6239 RepID=Q9U2J1_CAEEL|nr:Serpentine Receptor, class E (Epsilon) [Caenorhabditis elegans]CAB60340.3 Serpentine Receptor, class E (Epsilon) [Caenorhabditis elegans]|eukprot:NP_496928.3 Serpentine Receptor, class E (epsilon) [Caenorhabditis elegans]
MIFLIANLTTICWPIYILQNFKLVEFPGLLLSVLDFLLFFLTFYFAFRCAYLLVKVRVFHKNLSVLAVLLIFQWLEVLIGKIISWPYETGYWTLEELTEKSLLNSTMQQWWTENPSEMIKVDSFNHDVLFFIAGFLKIHFGLSMSNILLIVSVERSCASYFLEDYENKSRTWIALLIIFFSQTFTMIFSIVFFFNYLSYVFGISIIAISNIGAVMLMLYSRHYNQKITKIHEDYAHQSNYTLAARFQAKENMKCFEMIWKIVIFALCIGIVGFATALSLYFHILPELDTMLNLVMQAMINLPPLVVCPAIIYSVESFRSYHFLSVTYFWEKLKVGHGAVDMMPVQKKSFSVKHDEIRKETETYFNQLAASWI